MKILVILLVVLVILGVVAGGKFVGVRNELATQREGVAELRATVKGRTVTLLTATKELDLSHAVVLRALLT